MSSNGMQSKPQPRPFKQTSFYALKKDFNQKRQDFLDFLTALNHELDHRKTPFAMALLKEVREQIQRLEKVG